MPIAICENCKKAYGIGQWFECPHGFVSPSDAQIHSSEKVTVWENPSTGEVRIPGRSDRPIHPKYQSAGFTHRKTIDTHAQLRALERKTGTIHESSNYTKNSATAEKDTGSR